MCNVSLKINDASQGLPKCPRATRTREIATLDSSSIFFIHLSNVVQITVKCIRWVVELRAQVHVILKSIIKVIAYCLTEPSIATAFNRYLQLLP